MRKRNFRGQPMSRPTNPFALNLRILAIQVLAAAVQDARSRDPYVANHALLWLNSPEGRGIAECFDCPWVERPAITLADLPRARRTYFRGD